MSANHQITCLAVDNDPDCLTVIKSHIQSLPVLRLVGTCSHAVEALAILNQTKIDLLFLSIRLPYILGTDFIRTLTKPPKVIFTTAYMEYAAEAFELDAVDYLLKPVSFTRFLKAVNKVIEADVHLHSMPEAGIQVKEREFICLRADRKNIKVNFSDILFVEALQDYCKITVRDRTILTKQSLSALADMLPSSFIRIHRSYIVSLHQIKSYTPDMIEIDKHQLPVSRSYRQLVETVLQAPLSYAHTSQFITQVNKG